MKEEGGGGGEEDDRNKEIKFEVTMCNMCLMLMCMKNVLPTLKAPYTKVEVKNANGRINRIKEMHIENSRFYRVVRWFF